MRFAKTTKSIAATLLAMSAVMPALGVETSPVITRASAIDNSLSFAWTYATTPDWFTIQYSCDGGVAWTTIDNVPATLRTWMVATDVTADNCVVRIAAKTDNVNGVFSEPIAPNVSGSFAPTAITLDASTNSVSWDASAADNIAKYEVQSSTDEGVTWNVIGTTDASITRLQLPSVEDGSAIRVVAITTDGQRIAGEVQRALDANAADVVRTAAIPTRRIFVLIGIAVVVGLAMGQWMVRRRRRADLNSGFEDFDAISRG